MTRVLWENYPGLMPQRSGDGGIRMNARQWHFMVQSLGMHWAKAFLFFPKKPLETGGSDFSGIALGEIDHEQTFVVSKDSKSSLLGVPVFCDLVISSPDDSNKKLNIINPMVTVQQARHITTTIVQGRNGTVKEYIAEDDFAISIEGALFTDDGSYPERDVNLLIELLRLPKELSVYSYLLQLFDIHSAVVCDYKLSQTLMKDMQLFSLTMKSDEPFEIKNMAI